MTARHRLGGRIRRDGRDSMRALGGTHASRRCCVTVSGPTPGQLTFSPLERVEDLTMGRTRQNWDLSARNRFRPPLLSARSTGLGSLPNDAYA